jgi:hypothetical protein
MMAEILNISALSFELRYPHRDKRLSYWFFESRSMA